MSLNTPINLFKTLSAIHLGLSLLSILLFFVSLAYVQQNEKHVKMAKAYMITLMTAIAFGFLMAILSLTDPDFLYLGSNQSAQFLKSFRSIEITHFGYIVSIQRGLIVLIMAVQILFLQNVFSTKLKKILWFLLCSLLATTLYYYKNVLQFNLWPYHISTLALITSWLVISVIIRNIERSLKHATLAVFSFLIFLETGILGGVGHYLTALQTNHIYLYSLYRFIPLILTILFLKYRQRLHKN